ncbi:MAG: type I-MYXAN CRISPR-associated protein Cmx8 [Candidatus Eremiobacteraeota bacterium]|nr:type I-MYXAN CRISPR-associated protein Cmx8 [Candidatus Eremiobacteraeota bacterium]
MSKLDSYTLEYSLKGLPTVQHRTGLGGLVYLVDYLKEQDQLSPEDLPVVEVQSDKLKITVTPASLTTLFDVLYEPMTVTRTMKSKPKGDFETVTDEAGKVLHYTYQTERPAGRWLFEQIRPKAECAIPEGVDPWHRLWQDSLWSIFRGIPATRKVYEASKNRQKLVSEFWKAFEKLQNGKEADLEIASTIYVGAQAKSAEGLKFSGSPAEVLLLHFAHATAQPYKVVRIDSQGKQHWPGVIWVFLEPDNLQLFAPAFRRHLQGKPVDDPGFRSRSRVTIPQEAALSLMVDQNLSLALKETEQTLVLRGALCTQLEKVGNNINLLAASYVPYDQYLLRNYSKIVQGISSYPLRRLVLQNLLDGHPPFRGLAKLMSYLPVENTLALSGPGIAFSYDSLKLLKEFGLAAASERNVFH